MHSTDDPVLKFILFLLFIFTLGFSVSISMLGFISNEKDESFSVGYYRASAFCEERIRLYEQEVEQLERANKIFRRYILDTMQQDAQKPMHIILEERP